MGTPKPDWSPIYPEYDDLVKSWGVKILDAETFGAYQGDFGYILTSDQGYGLIIIGYGSCSACDALQAAIPYGDHGDWSAVIELADDLKKGIHWEPTKEKLMEWASTNPGNHWWAWDSNIKEWLNSHGATFTNEKEN